MVLLDLDGKEKRVKHTLMSGHRCTSMINSVLNAAYIRCVLGDDYDSWHSEHVGDDIIMSTDSAALVDSNLRSLLSCGLRFKRSKQAFGTHCAEFLRLSFDSYGGVGYLPRCIATAISGNWVTQKRLDFREYQESINQICWTLLMRSGTDRISLCLKSTLMRRLGLDAVAATGVCQCKYSLNGAPVFGVDGVTCRMTWQPKKARTKFAGKEMPTHAIDTFSTHSREVKALADVGVSRTLVKSVLIGMSYTDVLDDVESVIQWSVADECLVSPASLHCPWNHFEIPPLPARCEQQKLVLIEAFRGLLTDVQIGRLCSALGVSADDWLRHSCDENPACHILRTPIPYSDARCLGRDIRMTAKITTSYPLAA
jgi:hypothetical protein